MGSPLALLVTTLMDTSSLLLCLLGSLNPLLLLQEQLEDALLLLLPLPPSASNQFGLHKEKLRMIPMHSTPLLLSMFPLLLSPLLFKLLVPLTFPELVSLLPLTTLLLNLAHVSKLMPPQFLLPLLPVERYLVESV